MGAFIDGEWESICKLFAVEESPDLFLEYYSPTSFCNESYGPLSAVNNENLSSSLSGLILNPPNKFLKTTNPTNSSSNNNDAEKFLPDFLSCIDFTNMNEETDASVGHSFANETMDNSQTFKRKFEEESNSVEPPKKNAQFSKVVQKGKRNAVSKTDGVTQDIIAKEFNDNPDSNSDDSNVCDASEELNETEDSNSNTTVSLTSTGKKRASRGAATDPQSLYARKRRMRINERLKILQSLVPNGTKVDISTMLEEAFHYVKFLQLQIRMLSSDELWMYAPLAYNGIDIGDYRRMPHPFLGL